MPNFRLNKAFSVWREAKVFFDVRGGFTREAPPDLEYKENEEKDTEKNKEEETEQLRRRVRMQRRALKRLRRERQRARKLSHKQRNEVRRQELEIFHLKNELSALNRRLETPGNASPALQESDKPAIGALPDFVIIGAQKCGTTTLYQLLSKHSFVEPAAVGEVHYFDQPEHFEKGIGWYRRCFPPPRWKNGRRSITGEKTPKYLFDPRSAERMAQVIPQARLIVLLRNPVDRTYSHYHHEIRLGRESRTLEEAIEEEQARLLDKEVQPSESDENPDGEGRHSTLLVRGIYVDQLARWRQFFGEDQILVVKSEDYYKHTADVSRTVQDFLGLPYEELEPEPRRAKPRYQPMAPATRERLQAFFEPHNRRLYEYLGRDFGW